MEKVRRTPASLKKMAETFGMEILHRGRDFDTAVVTISDVNRPALQLVGFYDYFDDKRLQILGRGEMRYLERMTGTERLRVFNKLLSYAFPAMIVARNMDVPPELLQMAEKHDRTLLRAVDSTVDVTSRLIDYLNRVTAPQITRHGVLMNIYGQGVLFLGDSGIGKSEAALELIRRGHRLVTDDVVEIRKINEHTLVGTSPDITRYFIELRGIGIVDVKALFGALSVKDTQTIDLVIRLEDWDKDKEYDRLGLEENYTEYLGNKVVCHNIPIRPGRNLAVICETAAINHRQKKMGYNAAKELYTRVQNSLAKRREEDEDDE